MGREKSVAKDGIKGVLGNPAGTPETMTDDTGRILKGGGASGMSIC